MQDGTIKRRGGAWYLYYREDVIEPDGRIVRKKRGRRLAAVSDECRTESQARKLAEDILAPVNARNARPESTQTVHDFLKYVYLPAIKLEAKPSTIREYATCLRQIEPHLNGLTLRDTRTSDIQRILRAIAAPKPIAQSRLNNLRNFLSGAFRLAVQTDRVAHGNPVREVKVPKGLKRRPENCHAYSLEEVTAIMHAVPEPAKTIVLLAALTGLRHGEIRGLRWSDFTGNELRIQRAVWESYVDETKTPESSAPVPCVPVLKTALEAHRRRYPATDEAYIFAGERFARPLVLNNMLKRVMRPALKAAGLQWHGWHGFRRGLASNLNRLGIDDSVIQAIMRHANVRTTQMHYIKTTSPESQSAMKRLERAFKKSR